MHQDFRLIEDPEEFKPLLKDSLARFGHFAEHNLNWFVSSAAAFDDSVPVAAYWPDGRALLCFKASDKYYVFSEPVMPEEEKAERTTAFLEKVLHPPFKKVVFELETEARRSLLKKLPNTLRAVRINYTFTCPVMDMDRFDPTLPGKHWKSMRKARNTFYAEHDVKVVDAKTVDPKELYALLDRWAKERAARDTVYTENFRGLIASSFEGTTSARAFIVDGKVCGLNAGWEVPNRDIYYGAVGLCDYSFPDLGTLLYLEDMEWTKKSGYHTVDMGGCSDKPSLAFKNKFQPASWYKTFVFSVVRREKKTTL